MVFYVAGLLRSFLAEVVVVTSADLPLAHPSLAATDIRVIRDREPDLGPLGAIRDGLEAIDAERAYVTGTDSPFVTREFVERLFSLGDCTAPEVDGFVQSLSAVYPRSLLARAGELIAAGRMRPLYLLEAGGFRRVSASELPSLEPLRSLDTPDEYLSAVAASGDVRPVAVVFQGAARRRAGADSVDLRFGTLAQVLADAETRLGSISLLEQGRLVPGIQCSIDGLGPVADLDVPVGPGERVLIDWRSS